MNVDITTDQTQEIALMRRVIAAYPGDAAAVRVDPSMVHGMEGMRHGGHRPADHAGHSAAAPQVQAAPAAAAARDGRRPASGAKAAPPRAGSVPRVDREHAGHAH